MAKNNGWKHRLTKQDLNNMIADCKECGIGVPIINVGSDRIRCWWGRQKGGKYGDISISHSDKRKMFEKGTRLCPICKKTISFETAVLDHCHSSLIIREFLCNGCNLGLGLFEDNPETLRRGAKYIIRHKKEKYEIQN